MKKIAIATVLTVACGAFAWDEYTPVAAKKLEIDAMYTYTSIGGSYDQDAKKQSATGSPALQAPSLQFKYGIIDGLDVELAGTFALANKDAAGYYPGSFDDNGDPKSVAGLARPSLDVKYVHPALGIGGFIGADLPVGSEDIVGKNPTATLHFALKYDKVFGPVAFDSWAAYFLNLEDKDKNKAADILDIYLKPQYNVTDKIGPYLGLDFQKTFKSKTAGTELDNAGYLFTIKPGINYIISDMFSAELTVPVTLLGKNNAASYAIYAGFYTVLPL